MQTHALQEEAIRQAELTIRAAVGKLIGTTGIRESDAEDIAQILRMHVGAKASRHDPARSSLRTFIDRIVTNKVRDYLESCFAEARDPRRVAASLDDPMEIEDGGDETFGETLDAEDALRRAGLLPWPADGALSIDIKLLLDQFSEIDRGTCAVLSATRSLREAARDLGIHVETLRARVLRIRGEFERRNIRGMAPTNSSVPPYVRARPRFAHRTPDQGLNTKRAGNTPKISNQ